MCDKEGKAVQWRKDSLSTNDGAGTARLHVKTEESRCRPYTLHKN